MTLDKKEYDKEYYQRPEVKERMKEYYQRPEAKERAKEYYQRPEVKEHRKEYRKRPEVKKRAKEYNQRPEVKERAKEYQKRPEVKERRKEYNQRPEVKEHTRELERKKRSAPEFKAKMKKRIHTFERPYFNRVLGQIKNRAKKKFPDKLFNITIDYLEEIFPHKDLRCPVLNLQLKINPNGLGSSPYSPSLDRINNDKGYEKGNVIWVCNKANMIKGYSTPDEIIKVGKFYKELEKNVEV